MKKTAIILAAGKGTRMKSDLPKCAYPLLNKPMIEYLIESIERSAINDIITVVGHKKEIIMDGLGERTRYAHQTEQLGTGHAVQMTENHVQEDDLCILFPGDMPLLLADDIDRLIAFHENQKADLTVLTTHLDVPTGYGRILREAGKVIGIVEEKDATPEQKNIHEINTGVYCVNASLLFPTLKLLNNHNQNKEYYLTDIVSLIAESGKVNAFALSDDFRLTGINDLLTLTKVEEQLQKEIVHNHMLHGVHIVMPQSVRIDASARIEAGARILPFTVITGDSVIKRNAVVGPNSEVHNSTLGENVTFKHSVITDSKVMEYTNVGPFAHIRVGTVIGPYNRIGNFVEFKKTTTKMKTNASHLAYLGDAEIGENVNFGCGSITVNYDGKHKHKTVIGDRVFVGCNVNLIAPVEIDDDAMIAAGSTVNRHVPKGALAIARARQENKEGYVEKIRNKK